jgi:uncharacterized protein
MVLVPLLGILGVVAGALTTVAGMGGGILLLLALSLASSPAAALAATAPALLCGNLHRLWIMRRHVDRDVARAFVLGSLPGAFVGGFFAIAVPELLLRVLMAGVVVLALCRALGWWRPRIPVASITPAGGAIGALTATTGGAGLLASPLLMSAGLSGDAYVATSAAAAASMHLGRLAAYGAGGLLDRHILTLAAVLAVAVLSGNHLGHHLRRGLSTAAAARIEIATLAVCGALALAGLGMRA